MDGRVANRRDAGPSRSEQANSGADVAVLTRGLVRGDEELYREFHRRYFDRLYGLALVLTRGREIEAQEAVQETLCRVARHARRFDREEVFWCWLVALARSAVRDAGRRQNRYWRLLRSYARDWLPVVSRGAPEENGILDDLVKACVGELDPADRRLVEGKYAERRSTRDLAAEIGLTDRAVESRLYRLRGHLRERVLRRLREDAS